MSVEVSTRVSKKRLATVWFVAGFVLFLVLVLQSVLGKFGDRTEEAWAWFLPTLMPTLSLIIGVLVLDASTGPGRDKKVDRFMFRLAFALSAFYLFLVALTLFVQPFTGVPLLVLMQRSNLWLGPFQGLVAAALGAFFVKGESEA